MSARVNVLLFHQIVAPTRGISDVSPRMFLQCLDDVARSGCPVLTIGECGDTRDTGGTDAICLTFDDGWQTDVTCALPELLERRMRGTFFICTGNMGRHGFLSWSQVDELARGGMEVGSHSETHRDLRTLSDPELTRELSGSRQALEDRLGRAVHAFSVPHGFYDARVLRLARAAGYVQICVSKPGLQTLPIGAKTVIPRNALHSRVTPRDLGSFLRPERGALLRRRASYAGRAVLKSVLRGSSYQMFRRSVLAVSPVRRPPVDGSP